VLAALWCAATPLSKRKHTHSRTRLCCLTGATSMCLSLSVQRRSAPYPHARQCAGTRQPAACTLRCWPTRSRLDTSALVRPATSPLPWLHYGGSTTAYLDSKDIQTRCSAPAPRSLLLHACHQARGATCVPILSHVQIHTCMCNDCMCCDCPKITRRGSCQAGDMNIRSVAWWHIGAATRGSTVCNLLRVRPSYVLQCSASDL
jgi:hypothetical protein